ncbi:MAG: hypothetical protein WDA11_03930 [Thiohalomonadaceae bacterium]
MLLHRGHARRHRIHELGPAAFALTRDVEHVDYCVIDVEVEEFTDAPTHRRLQLGGAHLRRFHQQQRKVTVVHHARTAVVSESLLAHQRRECLLLPRDGHVNEFTACQHRCLGRLLQNTSNGDAAG